MSQNIRFLISCDIVTQIQHVEMSWCHAKIRTLLLFVTLWQNFSGSPTNSENVTLWHPYPLSVTMSHWKNVTTNLRDPLNVWFPPRVALICMCVTLAFYMVRVAHYVWFMAVVRAHYFSHLRHYGPVTGRVGFSAGSAQNPAEGLFSGNPAERLFFLKKRKG